jgi:WD40 repeat protein
MAPGGSLIVAGTETGNIAGLGSNGNLLWSYASNPENRQAAGITCSAVSDKGSVIAAGTADGKVLFLDSKGELKGSSVVHEYIRHIAMSTDGSVVVATSDDRVYAFAPGSQPRPTQSPSLTVTVMKTTTIPSPTESPASILIIQPAITSIMTEVPTTYSVIHTATQSPPALITLLVSFALVVAIFGRKR